MPMRLICFLLAQFTCLSLFSQEKKVIDHSDVQRWKKIEQTAVTGAGNWVAWVETPVTEGDALLRVWNSRENTTLTFARAQEPRFSADGNWLIFRIKPPLDSLKALRRKKVKEDDLPKDTLAVYDLMRSHLEKMPRVKGFSVPEKWSGWLFYQIDPEKNAPKDTSTVAVKDSSHAAAKPVKAPAPKSTKKSKKEDKDNGFRLIVRHLESGAQDTIAYVKEYCLAKKAPQLLLQSTGKGDTMTFPTNAKISLNGVYQIDLKRNLIVPHWQGKGKFTQLSLDESGGQAAFLIDSDTTKARIRPWQLCYRSLKQDSARIIASDKSDFLAGTEAGTPAWLISENARPLFSEDGSKLYFGIAPPPILNDTTLLPEEIVNVEVWSWTENRIYTQQKAQLEADKKKTYPVVWHVARRKFVRLGSPELPELRFQEQRNADIAPAYTEEPYAKMISWEGTANKDLYCVDLNTGEKKAVLKGLRCSPRMSPAGKYILWWSDPDTAWFAWNVRSEKTVRLTPRNMPPFYDEDNDEPDYPAAYGLAAWLDGDEAVLLYDRYDLWKMDPDGKQAPVRLTAGRNTRTVHRYLRLDPELYSLPHDARILLHTFQEDSKDEGYMWWDVQKGAAGAFGPGPGYACSKNVFQAEHAPALVYTVENFQVFPDLWYWAGDGSSAPRKISQANPQQSEYKWGSIEKVQWTSLSGEKLSGLLIKPEGFDPKRQYPMIVNFYEKLSDELHRHRSPDFHRSQINYTVYASKGYVVFAPDIPYRVGYPGECAYDAIVSGVTALIGQGFIDPKRVALQGHSWGGYQSAYIVTRTNLFTCAEAGAPVANMTSAYGGIRWETGLSRAFQYERQQSRIGGSLWEYPMRYLENSPLFSLDKVQTPLLILHNDKDGAVPWYQGIELYSGLRRLGKPCWLLNYNDEPHWPVKLQNRMDFQRRMQQFFDHYLMGAPEPRWMKRGVPPKEKGILQGLEDGD